MNSLLDSGIHTSRGSWKALHVPHAPHSCMIPYLELKWGEGGLKQIFHKAPPTCGFQSLWCSDSFPFLPSPPRMLTGPHAAVLWPCLSATIPGPFCACKPFQEGSPSISIIYVFWASQWLSGKESACQCRKHRFDPWVRKIPWRREWQSIPVFLSGKSHGQKSLAGHSPWGCKRVRNDLATK